MKWKIGEEHVRKMADFHQSTNNLFGGVLVGGAEIMQSWTIAIDI
jgi:hypothetical protein